MTRAGPLGVNSLDWEIKLRFTLVIYIDLINHTIIAWQKRSLLRSQPQFDCLPLHEEPFKVSEIQLNVTLV